MPWFTDAHLRATPGLADVDHAVLVEAASDAERILAKLTAVPGIDDSDLRRWAEGAGIPPERFNRATDVLQGSGRAIRLSPAIAPAVPVAVADSIPTEKFTKDELRDVADRLGLDVPKSATKADLADAISRS